MPVLKALARLLPAAWLGWAGAGCAGLSKSLPADYFAPRRTLTVAVVHCAETPVLRTDQPVGHAEGAGWQARNETMRRRLAGIAPDLIQLAVEEELARQLNGLFKVVGSDAQLALEVSITEWGWFVPTGRCGKNQGVRHFRLGGTATITDRDPARNDAPVFRAYRCADTPLADARTTECSAAAVPAAAADFAAAIVGAILQVQQP